MISNKENGYGSSQPVARLEGKQKVMGKIVRVTREQLPPLSAERKHELDELAARPDSEIDLSDIPETTDTFWKNARPFREVMEERRTSRTEKLTLSVDRDVAVWLRREDGKIDESRVNSALRGAMLKDTQEERKRA